MEEWKSAQRGEEQESSPSFDTRTTSRQEQSGNNTEIDIFHFSLSFLVSACIRRHAQSEAHSVASPSRRMGLGLLRGDNPRSMPLGIGVTFTGKNDQNVEKRSNRKE